jgi:SAM-dependent methyltransferase
MSNWHEGYVTDVGYTYGYYTELNPLRTRLALLNAGWAAPDWLSQGPACELGIGQGVSVNVHAAASGSPWWGTDFNPSQAAFAQELAIASSMDTHGTRLFDEAFADFCQRPDLPDFNFIGLHGIWSWISDANRAVIVDFVRRKLRVGGVLYVSYNTQPGWAATVPMRDLLTDHARVMGVPGNGIASRIDASLAFAERLMGCNPHYAQANPQVAVRLKRMQGMGRNYLAHEYFNRDWQPMSFSTMANWLASAKLTYGCSAHYLDHLPSLNFTPEQLKLLLEQNDPVFRETVRDFMVNQQFRRDYWIKGPRKLAQTEQIQCMRAQRLMLVTPAADVAMTVKVPVGEANLTPAVYEPVLSILGDHAARSVGELWQQLQAGGRAASVSYGQLVEALMLLTGRGDVIAVQDEAGAQQAAPFAQKLNRQLLERSRHTWDIGCLASPVSAGGVVVNRFEQLFILAMQEQAVSGAAPDAAALANFVWTVLQSQGQRLLRDGKPMEAAQDNLDELTTQARTFASKRLPTLRRMAVVE